MKFKVRKVSTCFKYDTVEFNTLNEFVDFFNNQHHELIISRSYNKDYEFLITIKDREFPDVDDEGDFIL